MIKKIDANEYGVVRYAITSVDELNRLPKKIAPSSQAILIENGLRVFVYGDGQWVEEVVDGDLSENMQSIVADYERSKIGHDGVKRGSLEERLKDDFQGIYDILNARDYCEYSGKELKVDNTWMGNQIDTKVEGRTLQNLAEIILPDIEYVVDGKIKVQGEGNHAVFIMGTTPLIKSNTTYTLLINVSKVENLLETNFFQVTIGERVLEVYLKVGLKKIKFTTGDLESKNLVFYLWTNYRTENGYLEIDPKQILILEGDHTQTPLSELPYFEGIESVGERDIGKNLFDGVLIEKTDSTDFEKIKTGFRFKRINGTAIQACVGFRIPRGTFNISYNVKGGAKSSNLVVRMANKAEPGASSGVVINSQIGIGQEKTFSANFTNTENDLIVFYTDQYDNIFEITNIQLEEGTQATAYEPFGYKISGKSCGKNLFDIKKWYGALYGDNTPSEITEEGKVIVYAINSDTYLHTGATGSLICREIERKHLHLVHENTTYTLSMKCEGENYALNYIQFYDENYNNLGDLVRYGTDTGFKITFRTPMGTKFLGTRIGIKNAPIGSSLCYSDFQLEENDHATPYEPYQESTYSIYSPIPLRSLPNGVCDVYDFESGAVIQRVGKIVLDGTENWGKSIQDEQTINNTTFFHTRDYDNAIVREGSSILELICDNFPTLPKTWSVKYEGVALEGDVDILRVRINLDRLSTQDADGFKQWLQANPMTIYCELKEPIIHYLTPSQLKSFDGTTHVISENTLIPTTTTKILTDTYANVSNVNSTAYSLRRGVNDVAETSTIINETDVEQDDVLDVTMCAIDELYSMLEPNLE